MTSTVELWAVGAAEMPRPVVLGFDSGGGINPASLIAFSSSCFVGSLMGLLLPELNGPGLSCLANSAVESLTDIGAIESSVAGVGELLPDLEGGVLMNLCSKSAPIADLAGVSFFGVSILLGFALSAGSDASSNFSGSTSGARASTVFLAGGPC